MKKPRLLLFFVVLVFFLSSCKIKQVSYFQDMEDHLKYQTIISDSVSDLTIKPKDELIIIVSSVDPNAVIPFNLFFKEGDVKQAVNTDSRKIVTYIVSSDGYINFPTLGKVKLSGLTTEDATEYLQALLKEYVKEPIVNLIVSNFRISVLGAVNLPGMQYGSGERKSVLEAISSAGDMAIYGRSDNVLLIRDENGKKEFIRLDLTKSDLFSSPYYYLQQNDIVYVEPNKEHQKDAGMSQRKQYDLTIITSTISSIIATVSLIIALRK